MAAVSAVLLLLAACMGSTAAFRPVVPRSYPTSLLSQEVTREEEVRSSLKEARETYEGVFAGVDDSFLGALKSRRSYLSIVAERLVQSLDDMQIAARKKDRKNAAVPSITTKPRIVVLGSGWGAYSFLKTVDASMYDVTVVSPRNYFLFTPMLAASAVGTVEFRSICEPIRNANELAEYLEATAVAINATRRVVSCRSVKCMGVSCDVAEFEVPYDHLIVAVGATSNTFGIKGVRENCIFLKQIEDAASLRTAILSCFERANVPDLSDEERRSALSFVVVGAGPTGVEFTSELRDFIETEGRRYYGKLLRFVSIKLLEAGDALLPVFDKALQQEALTKLLNRKTSLIEEGLVEREPTQVLLKAGVSEIAEKEVVLSSGEKIPYGFCVWAAGNGPVPLVLDLIEGIPEQREQQSKARGRLVTDPWMRVLGADGVLGIGDCAFCSESPLPATAQVASQEGSYLGRLFSKGYDMRIMPVPSKKLEQRDSDELTISERVSIGELGVRKEERAFAKPFQFLNLGILAYVGASEALAQVAVDEKQILGSGPVGYLLWRGIYWSKQVSWRNRLLVAVDWAKGRLFGRDIGSI